MSVLVRDISTNLIKLYVKGADNVILERSSIMKSGSNIKYANKFVESASQEGLRTLLVAMKVVSEDDL
jgi:magnesium-transporting ATPase (P-type)